MLASLHSAMEGKTVARGQRGFASGLALPGEMNFGEPSVAEVEEEIVEAVHPADRGDRQTVERVTGGDFVDQFTLEDAACRLVLDRYPRIEPVDRRNWARPGPIGRR